MAIPICSGRRSLTSPAPRARAKSPRPLPLPDRALPALSPDGNPEFATVASVLKGARTQTFSRLWMGQGTPGPPRRAGSPISKSAEVIDRVCIH
jgi:hypothetical protein